LAIYVNRGRLINAAPLTPIHVKAYSKHTAKGTIRLNMFIMFWIALNQTTVRIIWKSL